MQSGGEGRRNWKVTNSLGVFFFFLEERIDVDLLREALQEKKLMDFLMCLELLRYAVKVCFNQYSFDNQ